jgi:voltage-gated potassium channel
MLRDAGVERAAGLLAASDSDAGNTFITLTAKSLNPGLYVVARAAYPDSQPRMLRAGADRVFSPYLIAGRQMAISALHPIVTEFIDSAWSARPGEPVLAEIEITPDSGFAGRAVADVLNGRKSVLVLGVRKATGEVLVAPPAETLLEARDRIIVMGPEPELEAVQPDHRHAASR